MTLRINELGEFVDDSPPYHDARRRDVYRSCFGVDASAFKEKMDQRRERKRRGIPEYRQCKRCGKKFALTTPNKVYCSQACQRADYDARRYRESSSGKPR